DDVTEALGDALQRNPAHRAGTLRPAQVACRRTGGGARRVGEAGGEMPYRSRRNQARGSQRRNRASSSEVGGGSSATASATRTSHPQAARAASTRSAKAPSPAGTAVRISSSSGAGFSN